MSNDVQEIEITRFPTNQVLCGPVAASRLRRLLFIYITVLACGTALALGAHHTAWQIFGLSLILPGGGFLAHADLHSLFGFIHIGMALGGVAVFSVSLIIWFATGNVLAPPVTWLLLAGTTTTMRHGHVHGHSVWLVVCTAIFLAILMSLYAYVSMLRGNRQRQEANDWLEREGRRVAGSFSPASATHPELSHDELKQMRFLLDRALQPVDEFNGFEWLDQFQTAAIRYQLNFIGYALAIVQATHLPAFQGYLTEAQKRLLLKQTDHRIWSYWATENLWGNLRYDPDPVKRENIMYTGFCATQMVMFHHASGRDDFIAAGSFTLNHLLGPTYAYSLHDLIVSMQAESERSDFQLIACEPNWIYPLCNTIGAVAVKAQAPTEWNKQQPGFKQMLDQEFLGYGTSIVPCRSNYTGLALPAIGGAMPQAMPCFFMSATMPDVALRQWLQLRRSVLRNETLDRSQFWRIDTGNYRFSRAAAYAATALAAAELGDDQIKELCLTALDEECPVTENDGIQHRAKASIWAHAVEFVARVTTPHAFRNLMNSPHKHTGPYISSVNYPDVLVASAYTENNILKAVLYPDNNPSNQEVSISGLTPGQSYSCEGTEEQSLIANAEATAVLHVHLAGRTEILIKPVT